MRRLAAAVVLGVLTAPLAAQRAAITWEAAGTPPVTPELEQRRQIAPPLTSITVTSIAVAPWGDVFATSGTRALFRVSGVKGPWEHVLVGDGAHLRTDGPAGDEWSSLITVTPNGTLLAETQVGLFRSRDRGQTWQRTGLIHQVRSLVSTRRGLVLAGTPDGVFRSADEGESWIERSIGLTSFRVQALAIAADGTIHAGTSEGETFRSTDEGDRWRASTASYRSPAVRTLAVLGNGDVLTGGHPCLIRWKAGEPDWDAIYLTADRRATITRALLQDARGYVFAGTDGDGVFVSLDGGTSWQPANDGLPAKKVLTLVMDGDGNVMAGTSEGMFRATIGAGAK